MTTARWDLALARAVGRFQAVVQIAADRHQVAVQAGRLACTTACEVCDLVARLAAVLGRLDGEITDLAAAEKSTAHAAPTGSQTWEPWDRHPAQAVTGGQGTPC